MGGNARSALQLIHQEVHMSRHSLRPSPALVISTIALVVALGGTSYAAFKVSTKNIKNGAVTTAKLHNRAVTNKKIANGAITRSKINVGSLGTVPDANHANTANTANSANGIAAPEAYHEVGSPGEPAFQNSWHNNAHPFQTAAFYKDHEGVVHLRGAVSGGSAGTVIFQLPPGYRPPSGADNHFAANCACSTSTNDSKGDTANVTLDTGLVVIVGPGVLPGGDGAVVLGTTGTAVSFEGITFRAGS